MARHEVCWKGCSKYCRPTCVMCPCPLSASERLEWLHQRMRSPLLQFDPRSSGVKVPSALRNAHVTKGSPARLLCPEDGSHLLGLSCGHRGLDLVQSDAPRPAPVTERSFEAYSPPAVSGVQR